MLTGKGTKNPQAVWRSDSQWRGSDAGQENFWWRVVVRWKFEPLEYVWSVVDDNRLGGNAVPAAICRGGGCVIDAPVPRGLWLISKALFGLETLLPPLLQLGYLLEFCNPDVCLLLKLLVELIKPVHFSYNNIL
ncbi:hypothetical protein B0H16DRAFT_1458107 [Mycena metata]|uniref:Uncharacterized protein n=1 Tax=Mycena metata TaxID=1033252 RepID=A0AAD7J8B8_9AGAR|nr:hypothetical protein B0H16DRAFT_1458107 [Mycena metata]